MFDYRSKGPLYDHEEVGREDSCCSVDVLRQGSEKGCRMEDENIQDPRNLTSSQKSPWFNNSFYFNCIIINFYENNRTIIVTQC